VHSPWLEPPSASSGAPWPQSNSQNSRQGRAHEMTCTMPSQFGIRNSSLSRPRTLASGHGCFLPDHFSLKRLYGVSEGCLVVCWIFLPRLVHVFSDCSSQFRSFDMPCWNPQLTLQQACHSHLVYSKTSIPDMSRSSLIRTALLQLEHRHW
jgi:hypothetical protein